MSAMASQMTGISIVHSTVCSGADQRKHQSSASLAFVRGFTGDRWFPAQRTCDAEMFAFDDVIMFNWVNHSDRNIRRSQFCERHLHFHDNVIKWKHFPRYWPFVRGIHRWPVTGEFPAQRPWRGALMFSLICVSTNGWVNNRTSVIWDAIALIMTS